jgi:hypothetical protein
MKLTRDYSYRAASRARLPPSARSVSSSRARASGDPFGDKRMPLVRDRPRGIARSRSPHAFAGPWALTSGMTAEAGHEIAVPDAYRRRCSPPAPTQERQRCQGRLRRLGWTRTNNVIAVRRLLVEPDDPEVLPRCTANEPRCRCPGCCSARPVSDKPGHARPVPPGQRNRASRRWQGSPDDVQNRACARQSPPRGAVSSGSSAATGVRGIGRFCASGRNVADAAIHGGARAPPCGSERSERPHRIAAVASPRCCCLTPDAAVRAVPLRLLLLWLLLRSSWLTVVGGR